MRVGFCRAASPAVSLLAGANRVHSASMTELLEKAIERVRSFPPEAQDDFARVLLRLTGDETEIVALTEDEQAVIAASKTAAARGDFATDEEVRAVWATYGL